MPLLTKTESEFLQEARQYLEENTEITNLSPGSTARALLEIAARHHADQLQILNANVIQAFVSRSSGEFLDRIGELFGITRKTATYAVDTSSNNFKFYIDPSLGMTAQEIRNKAYTYATGAGLTPSNITDTGFIVRSGTSIGGPDGILYRTTEDARFEGTTSQVYVGVIATGLGPYFNVSSGGLTSHTIANNHQDLSTVASLIHCTNISPISTGKGLEGDEELRFRITRASVAAEAANETAVRVAALSVPGVNDVLIRKYTEGIGTYNIFVIGDAPIVSEGVINATQAAIESIQALGMRGSVSTPTYLGVEIVIAVKFTTGTSLADKHDIRLAAAQNMIDYINNIPIGGQLIINELVQRIMETSDNLLDMRVITFGYGDYDTSTGKNKDFIPLMVTNQSSQWDEKWYTNASLCAVCEIT